jgi:hypothetical protein
LKELSVSQKARILSEDACSNPLYLLVLVSELCQFGDFFQLNAKIEEYLSARNTKELFSHVLARLELDTAQPGHPACPLRCVSQALQTRRMCSPV